MTNMNVTFKSSFIDQMSVNNITPKTQSGKAIVWVDPPVANIQPQFPIKFPDYDTYVKREKAKKIAGGVAGALLLILAFVKRKAITNFVKKLFNKKLNPTNPTKKIELPKPQFTCGAENAVKFAEEKKQYIESIWQEYIHVNPPYVPMNPEKNILGLKALQKYGTVEDLRKLPDNYCISKDNAIMKEYAKLVGKVGELKDYTLIAAKTNKEYSKYYNEETMEDIMKSLREILVNRSKTGELINTSYPKYLEYERLSKHTNKTISQCAKDIMRRLEQDNPWLLE